MYANDSVKTFTSADGMAYDRVNGFCQDSRGILWICNWYGLECFDGYRFQCFRPQKELDANSRMKKAILTPDNHIVVLTVNGKMLSFSLNDYTYSTHVGEFPKKGIPFQPSFTDRKGNLWEKTSVGIRLVSPMPVNYYFQNNELYPLPRVFYEDSEQLLWIAWSENTGKETTEGEVALYNLDGKRIKTIFEGNAVYSIYEDKRKNVWLGTRNEGLVVLKPDGKGGYKEYRYSHADNNPSLSYNILFDITEDSLGRIWIATLGGGINVVERNYDVSNLSFVNLDQFPSERSRRVRSLLESDGFMLIATDDGLFKTSLNQPVAEMEFMRMFPTKEKEFKPADELIHLTKTKDGKILVSSFGKGIYEFDNVTNKFSPYVANDIARKQAVYSMLENQDGRLWVTVQTDLLLYNKNLTYGSPIEGNFVMIETKPLRDSRGQCWFATRKGALCVKDGQSSFMENDSSEIAFTDVTYHLPNMVKTRPLSLADTLLHIQPHERNLSVYVSALRYSDMENVRYAWRIMEQDTVWTELEHGNEIIIPTLQPGEWTLEVRSTNSSGQWTDHTTKLLLKVQYLWHETDVARGIMVLCIVVGILLLVWTLFRLNRLKRMYDSLLNSQPVVMVRTAMTDIKSEDNLTDEDMQFINNLNVELENRIHERDFSIDALATSMGVCRSVLYRRLKMVVGQSPVEYINEFKLQRATKLLMSEPNKTVAEIAYECGFSTPQYFSNTFRKRYHTTPNEWRKNIKEQNL